MACAFCQALQALVLIDLDIKAQLGDLQPAKAAIRVVEAVRKGKFIGASAGCGNLIGTGAAQVCGRIIDIPGNTGCRNACSGTSHSSGPRGAGVGLGNQHRARSRLVGVRTAKRGRSHRCVLAAVDIALLCHAAPYHRDLLH